MRREGVVGRGRKRNERERGEGGVGKRGFKIIWWVLGLIQRGDDNQWKMA
jgi:hypothetical protein